LKVVIFWEPSSDREMKKKIEFCITSFWRRCSDGYKHQTDKVGQGQTDHTHQTTQT